MNKTKTNLNCIILLMIAITSTGTKSNDDWSYFSDFSDDYEKPPCDWQNSLWCDKPSAAPQKRRIQLVFTAPDMNKNGQNPDTSFSNIYNGINFNLQAWKMLSGEKPQQEISLLFGLPSNCDTSKPFEITLYLFVQKNNGSSGDKGNIRISIDSKDTLQKLGPDFLMTVSTGDFNIIEPLEIKTLKTLIVKKEFYAPALLPGGLLALIFDRIEPTLCTRIDNDKSPVCTQDYSKDIFLESVVFSFYENECL